MRVDLKLCFNSLDGGRVVGDTVALRTEVLDVAEYLIRSRIRVERSETLVLDILHPERIIRCSGPSTQW